MSTQTRARSRRTHTITLWPLFLGIAFAVVPLQTQTAHAKPKQAALVIDANNGRVISAHAPDEARYPASLTKMMTLYMVFDLIEKGRLSYNSRITMSEEAASQPPSKLGLKPGEEISVGDAVRSLVTKSANDIAVAVAERIAGSEAKFASLMTAKARAIGMKSTTFKNASGLPDDDQVTTARDMVTLALHLQDDFPEHYKMFSMRDFRYGRKTYANHNTLLGKFEGTEGIKTGYTRASGYNLVASVKRGRKHVIGVVFGGTSAGSRNQTMRTLLNLALVKGTNTKSRKPEAVAVARREPASESVPEPRRAERRVAARTNANNEASDVTDDATTKGWKNVEIARVRPVQLTPRAQARTAAAAIAAPSAQQLQSTTQTAVQPPDSEREVARGMQPSTLGQQAAALSAASSIAPVPGRMAAGAPVGNVGAAQGTMSVQVGAYSTSADAERQLNALRATAADVIGGASPVAIQATSGGRTIYRARFTGFDASGASRACNELRRRRIDCLVAR